MDPITIYPENEKQKTLLKSLLEQMRIRFEVGASGNPALLTEKEYFAKIDKALEQVESGQAKILTKEQQKGLLGL